MKFHVLRVATWVVGAHLVIASCHGAAHLALDIPSTPADDVFRIGVVAVLPVLALALLHHSQQRQLGAVWLTLAMAASWFYGAVNHFVFTGRDHVGTGSRSHWDLIFTTTAVLLFILEMSGTVLGGWIFICGIRQRGQTNAK